MARAQARRAIRRASPTSSCRCGDPRALTREERAGARSTAARRANMVDLREPATRRRQGHCRACSARQFGLARLDRNWLADDDGISQRDRHRRGRPRRLHSVHEPRRSAGTPTATTTRRTGASGRWSCTASTAPPTGGENALLDHEIAYLQLRDADPGVRARADAARCDDDPRAHRRRRRRAGRRDRAGVLGRSGERCAAHALHGAHAQHRVEATDPAVRDAAARLERMLAGPSPCIHRLTLQPGMGILCNNVLHDRSGFVDDPARPRLLYRARYYDRIRRPTRG